MDSVLFCCLCFFQFRIVSLIGNSTGFRIQNLGDDKFFPLKELTTRMLLKRLMENMNESSRNTK